MIERILDWPLFLEHWGRRPMHARGDVVLYPEDVDVLLRFAYPDVSADGNLHLEDVHRRWPAVAVLCAELEERLSHPVHAGLHRTRGSEAAGCDPVADLLVLTLSGGRSYTVIPDLTVALSAGDVLYIPRGHAWTAAAANEDTLHVVLRIPVLTVLDLLHALADVHAEDARPLREAVRLADVDLQAGLAARIPEIADAPRLDDAVARLGTQFASAATVAPDGQFASLHAPLDADKLLRRRSPALVRVEDGKASIVFGGNSVSGPMVIAPALHFIAERTWFRPRDLPELSPSASILLARRLLLEGLLSSPP